MSEMGRDPGRINRPEDPARARGAPPGSKSDASRAPRGRPGAETAGGAGNFRGRRGTAGAGERASGTRSLAERLGAGDLLGIGVLLLGLVSLALLVAAELSPVLAIEIQPAGSCEIIAEPELREQCQPTGGSRHSWALALIGVLVLIMAWGAGPARSRAAAIALLVAGLAVLAIVLLRDLPTLDETGEIGVRFQAASAGPASGFWLSLAGGAVALAAGVLALLRPRGA